MKKILHETERERERESCYKTKMIDVQEGSSEIKRMEEREKERKSNVCVSMLKEEK